MVWIRKSCRLIEMSASGQGISFVTWLVLFMVCGALASSQCKRQIDLAFVMDRSASMGETNFNYIKKFVQDVVQRFAVSPEETRVGVIPFSHYYKVAIKFDQFSDLGELSKAIDNLPYEGAGSSLSPALKITQLELFNPENGARTQIGTKDQTEKDEVLQAVVVVTDGGSSTGIDSLLNSAETLKDSGKRVFVVGLGQHENIKNLKMMSSEPQENHCFLVEKGKDLYKVIGKLTKAICKDIKPEMKEFTVTENNQVLTSQQYQTE